MTVERPRAVVASSNHWTSPAQLGTHRLARALVAAGWDVAFLSHPISPLHLAGGRTPELRQRWSLYRHGGTRDLDGHLWAYVPGALVVPRRGWLLAADPIERGWQRLAYPDPARLLRREGFADVDLVLVDNPVMGFVLDAVHHRWSVLRIPDRLWAAPGTTPAMAAHLRRIVRSVDLVAYTARSLAPEIEAMRPHAMLHLPNGIDLDRFEGVTPPPPRDLDGVARPIAIYVGAMEEWFDFALVTALAAALDDVSFVLVGPDRLARRRLPARPNLHLLGARSSAVVPAYLRAADVGIIPFDVAGHRDLVSAVHPLKLYEYLAAGLPVVAAEWEELRMTGSPARLCRSFDEWEPAVRDAIARGGEASRAFARGHAWDARLDLLLGALQGRDAHHSSTQCP